MSRVKNVARWLVLPFGSFKIFAILMLFFALSRAADWGSTYWGLSQVGFDFSEEKNPINRMLITSFGFSGAIAINSFFALVTFLPLFALLSHVLWEKYPRFAKVAPVAALMSVTLAYFLVSMNNFELPYQLYLVLSPQPHIASAYKYLWMVVILTQIIWIPLVCIFLLCKMGYGKEKIVAP